MKIILKSLSKWKLTLYVLFAVLYSLQGLLLSFIIQFAGEINPRDKGALLVFGIGGIALFVLIYACMYIDNLLVRSIIKEFNILISGRTLTYFHLKKLEYTEAELNSFLTQDIPMFWQEFLTPMLIYPVFGLSILASIVYLIMQNFFIGCLFTIGGFLMIIPQFVFNKLLQKRGEELSKARKKSLSSITDFSKGIQTIQSNQAGIEFSQHVLKEISETEHQQYTYYTTHNLVMFWTGPLKGLGLIGPLLTGLLLLPSTTLSLTTLIAMMTASMNLISPLQQLLEMTSNLQGSTVVKKKVVSILKMPEVNETTTILEPLTEKLSIQIDDLTKTFGDHLIFRNTNLTIAACQKVLLTGASGSGKTSLFHLLCGEDKKYSGSIELIDRKGESCYPSYDRVNLIHQKPYLFKGTVKENLTLFQEFSDDQLQKILESVHLWDELAGDLEYQIDPQNLSGGQMMKLEIARCILRPKPILLADEVTAALDETNAREIRKILAQQKCTLIEIAHKYQKEDYDSIYQIVDHKIIKMDH